MQQPTLSVIVPVFNERLTLRKIVDRVRAVPIPKEILVVDDGSTDGSADVVRALIESDGDDALNRLRGFFHTRNLGKGAAIRTALPHVAGAITLIQDADLEYDPDDYAALVGPILAGQADVVYGSRFLGTPRRVLLFRHTMGNRFLTFLSNLCTDLNLTDMLTCYKALRTDLLREMPLTSSGFQIEAELTAKIARLGCRVYEVPISYHGREYWQGKKTTWRDGAKAVWTILKYAYVDDRENNDEGYTTLQRLRHVHRYNAWVWSLMQPHVGDRVLEVGCGVGAFTQFLRERERVVATDSNDRYLRRLQTSFERFDNVEVREIDWENPDLEMLQRERFDTIVCLNVLEHIANDDGALDTFAALLQPGGRLVLQVPAMHALYGEIDRGILHFRRYEMGELTAKLRDHGFEIAEARYFNLPGMLGWWVNSVLLKRRSVPGVQARVANLLVPWLRFESRLRLRRGMALLVVARRVAGTAVAAPFRVPQSVAH